MTKAVDILFTPYKLGETELPNRIVMAPMTRWFADDNSVSTKKMAAYYARRADAGLIITEGAIIRPDGRGHPNTPGIYTGAQIEGWRKIADAVHDKGGRIFMQLWHVGRMSHTDFTGGVATIAPSAVAAKGRVPSRSWKRRDRRSKTPYPTPRPLETNEIPSLVEAYTIAAANAIKAGLDGVEVHGANGYLIDQFLHYETNRREDEYGGTPENLARFALEVVDGVIGETGSERVGIRLSPAAYASIGHHADDTAVLVYLLGELEKRELAYVHIGINDDSKEYDYLEGTASAFIRRHYKGTVIGCGSYTPESAARAISDGVIDLAAFGRPFIANPDLVEKIKNGAALISYDEGMLEVLT